MAITFRAFRNCWGGRTDRPAGEALGPFRRTYNRSLPDWALPYSLPWVEDCSYYREEHAICV